MNQHPSFIFFGTSSFSVHVLDALSEKGLIPLAVVTFPDKPKNRKLEVAPNPVKSWALLRNVSIIEISTFKDNLDVRHLLEHMNADVFVVASFGKIIPADVIYMPKAKTLNIHPSLLPKLRGPSPIQEAILHENTTGITIMRLNEKMDEGPIVSQKVINFPEWPVRYSEVEKILGHEGGLLLADILPKWVSGEISEVEQNHTASTYTKMISKKDADITDDVPEKAMRKIMAYEIWPRARMGDLIITDAHITDGVLVLDSVIPPGKKQMRYQDYLRGSQKK